MSYLPVANPLDQAFNETLAEKIMKDPSYVSHVVSFFNGKIYNCDARDGFIDYSKECVDVNAFVENKIKGAKGLHKEAAQIDPFTDYYKGLLEEHKKIVDKLSGTYLPFGSVKGAASPGSNTIETPYEVVRRVNALIDVVGPKYRMANFNALEVVNVRPVDQLNFVGFTKNAVMDGTPEIGDHVTPPPVRQAFTAYDKAIYADSFRYEFSQRDKRDSVINIEQEMIADIPGAMAAMKDAKITTPLNAMASLGDLADWDAVTGNFYTSDAAGHVEDNDNQQSTIGGATHIIMPRDVRRLYLRNIQSAIGGTPPPSAEPDGARMFRLPLNDHIMAVINNQITANTYIVISKPSWADFFQGPTISVAYQNKMTPGQVEGSLLFDFNGFKEKLALGARKQNGLT